MLSVRCRRCGADFSIEASACPRCGTPNPEVVLRVAPASALPSGNDPALLPQVRGWSWGACVLTWAWAFAHNLPSWAVGFLAAGVLSLFVPGVWVVALVAPIYFGMKGNELAWQQRPFRDLEEFRATEAVWRKWAILVMVAQAVFLVVGAAVAAVLLKSYLGQILGRVPGF